MLQRIKFIFDNTLTVSNALDKSIIAYGADFEIFRFSGSQRHLGIEGNCLNLGQLRNAVNQLSNYLMNIGVRRFDRVAVCKRGAIDYLIISLAIYRCGGISVPINGSMPDESLQRYLIYTGSRFVFVDNSTVGKLDSTAIAKGLITEIKVAEDDMELLGTEDNEIRLSAQSTDFKAVKINDHDDVIIVHTSGTTGFPKGVLHGSHSLIRSTKAQLKLQPVTRNNVFLTASPANHHITQASVFANLTAGIPAYVPSEDSPSQLLKIIERERISLMLAFPDVYMEMCAQNLSEYDLSSMKIWMAGGDSSHEAQIKKLTGQGAFLRIFNRKILGSAYTEFFGTSEVGFAALMKTSFGFTQKFQRCVGKPTPFSPKVKIADSEGNPLPPGQPGRLMVKGPTLFKGYWNAHDKLHGVFIDGWWWTGDIAYKDSQGHFYHLDREVDVINTEEAQVFSLPIEEAILKHPDVYEAVVVSKSQQGKIIPHVIVQAVDGRRIGEQTIRELIAEQLGGLPSFDVEILNPKNDIPRGLTGKVLKRQLRESLESIPQEQLAVAVAVA